MLGVPFCPASLGALFLGGEGILLAVLRGRIVDEKERHLGQNSHAAGRIIIVNNVVQMPEICFDEFVLILGIDI